MICKVASIYSLNCELSAYPAPHFWLSVFWVRGIQEIIHLMWENDFQTDLSFPILTSLIKSL